MLHRLQQQKEEMESEDPHLLVPDLEMGFVFAMLRRLQFYYT